MTNRRERPPVAPRRTSRILRLGALRLIRESSFPSPKPYATAVTTPAHVASFMAPYVARETSEVLWAIALDNQHAVVDGRPIEITRGIVDASLVHPREIFRALIVAGAAATILVHNHTSSSAAPSKRDVAISKLLARAGRLLGIPVNDHVIVAARGKAWKSLRKAGLMMLPRAGWV